MQSLFHITNYSFSPVIGGDESVVGALTQCLPVFLATISAKSINDMTIKDVHKVASSFLNEKVQRISRKDERRLCFEALFVLLLYNSPDLSYLRWSSTDMLLESYPQFSHLAESEQNNLLNFRNIMVFALLVIPAKNRMEYLVDLVTRIVEGHEQKHYVNGSGAKPAARNRFAIYYLEGNAPRQSRAHFGIAATRKEERKLCADGKNGALKKKKRSVLPCTEVVVPLETVPMPAQSEETQSQLVKLEDDVQSGMDYEVTEVDVTELGSTELGPMLVTYDREITYQPAEEQEPRAEEPRLVRMWSEDQDLISYLCMDNFLEEEEVKETPLLPFFSPGKPMQEPLQLQCPSPNCVSFSPQVEGMPEMPSPVDDVDWNQFLDF